MHIDMDVHSEIWFFAPCQSGWKHHHLDPILGAHEDQYHIAAGAQGCLGIDSQASSTRPTMVPCFLRIWSVGIESWFLSNLAAETFAKLRQNLWSTSRHKDPTGNFPKIPRWGKSERPKVLVPYMKASGSQCYSSRMFGCMFKSCGALITVRTRYRSETDRNVTNKLCWYLLYYCTEDWSDVAVSSSSPFFFPHHLHFTVYPPKKQRKNLAPPNLLGSDTGLPLAVCLGAELGDNLKALGIVSKLHEQDEVRKVNYMRCHTYAMEARMAWWSHKLDNEAWSHPYCLSLEEKQPLFLEIVVSATGSKVFVHFNGDGIKSNNMATPLGYLAKKASDEQPMVYGSLCVISSCI